jgi:hypothetical protein
VTTLAPSSEEAGISRRMDTSSATRRDRSSTDGGARRAGIARRRAPAPRPLRDLPQVSHRESGGLRPTDAAATTPREQWHYSSGRPQGALAIPWVHVGTHVSSATPRLRGSLRRLFEVYARCVRERRPIHGGRMGERGVGRGQSSCSPRCSTPTRPTAWRRAPTTRTSRPAACHPARSRRAPRPPASAGQYRRSVLDGPAACGSAA